VPIYELYCDRCHTIYNFFSSRVDTETIPACPRAGKEAESGADPGEPHVLKRKPARFAVLSARSADSEDAEDDMLAGMDEERMASAMESWMGEMETSGADPDDPRQMARMFRRFGEAAGLEAGPKMEEMLHRLEAGEDPDALEEEMGGDLDGADDDEGLEEFFRLKKKATALRTRRPRVDPELYFL